MGKQLIADVLSEQTKNPTVTGFISELGEVKEGDSFKRRGCTLTDKSGSIPLILWGDDVNRVELNKYYTIEKGWLKDYEGEFQLQLGKYAKLLLTDESQMMPPKDGQAKIDESKSTATLTNKTTNDFAIPQFVYDEAGKSVQQYYDKLKNLGCESPDGMAAVWNTVIMRWRK